MAKGGSTCANRGCAYRSAHLSLVDQFLTCLDRCEAEQDERDAAAAEVPA